MNRKKYGIVSYNIHGNYTNYGSILQSYALQKAIDKYVGKEVTSVIIDYWADVTIGSSQLDPLRNNPDVSEDFRLMIARSMPAIIENYNKIKNFVEKYYYLSKKEYSRNNFNESYFDEALDGYVVGSDAVWMIDYFGKDDAFWGNYDLMRQSNTIGYAISVGESNYSEEELSFVSKCLSNFKALGLRESKYMDFIQKNTTNVVERVVDPTLLLNRQDYTSFCSERLVNKPYLLMYSRKYDGEMNQYAEMMAKRYGLEIAEISLQAQNCNRHIMFYDAGIEEFLSLIYHSENVITNSLHAVIFSLLFHRPVSFFPRGNAGNKVREMLGQYNLRQMIVTQKEKPVILENIDFNSVDKMIEINRIKSIDFLKKSLI